MKSTQRRNLFVYALYFLSIGFLIIFLLTPKDEKKASLPQEEIKKVEVYQLTNSGNEIARLGPGSIFYQKNDWIIYEQRADYSAKQCSVLFAYNTQTLIRKELFSSSATTTSRGEFACTPFFQAMFEIDSKLYFLTTTDSYWVPEKVTYEIVIGENVDIRTIGNFLYTHGGSLYLQKYANKYYIEAGNGDDCISFYSLQELDFTKDTKRAVGGGSNDCGIYDTELGFYKDQLINASGIEPEPYSRDTSTTINELYFSSLDRPNATTSVLSAKDLKIVSDTYGQLSYDPGRGELIFFNKEKGTATIYNLETKKFGPRITYPLDYKRTENTQTIIINNSTVTEKHLGNNHRIKLISVSN